MRFGIRFIEYVGDSHEVIRLAALAEAAGGLPGDRPD